MTDENDSQKALDSAIGEYIKNAAPYANVADFELGWKRCNEWQSQQAQGEAPDLESLARLAERSEISAEVTHDEGFGNPLRHDVDISEDVAAWIRRQSPAPAAVPEWESEAKRAFWTGLEMGASMGAVRIAPRWEEYIEKRKSEISAAPAPAEPEPEAWKCYEAESGRPAIAETRDEMERYKAMGRRIVPLVAAS